MKRILKGMAEAAKKTAFFAIYQPKEPDILKKKEKQ